MDSSRRSIAIDWAIRGYHAYRIRPHVQIRMNVVPEPTNQFDPDAFKVMMPDLNNIPVHLRNEETRSKQCVWQIAGKIVGRVPTGLCSCFRRLVDENYCNVQDITCVYRGTVRVAEPRFGPEISCTYCLSLPKRSFKNAMSIFEETLSREDLEKFRC